MREQPHGHALLACARQVLRDEILPELPASRKHALLMVMNAMAIAERQLLSGDQPEARELIELRALFDDSGLELVAGNRRLARSLRKGAADPGAAQRGEILAHLRRVSRQRLAESNPKALGGTTR